LVHKLVEDVVERLDILFTARNLLNFVVLNEWNWAFQTSISDSEDLRVLSLSTD
jgi:hypothetical protein